MLPYLLVNPAIKISLLANCQLATCWWALPILFANCMCVRHSQLYVYLYIYSVCSSQPIVRLIPGLPHQTFTRINPQNPLRPFPRHTHIHTHTHTHTHKYLHMYTSGTKESLLGSSLAQCGHSSWARRTKHSQKCTYPMPRWHAELEILKTLAL